MQRTIALLLVCAGIASAQLQINVATESSGFIPQRTPDPCAARNLYDTLFPSEALTQQFVNQQANPSIVLPTQRVCSGTPDGWPYSAVTLSAPSPFSVSTLTGSGSQFVEILQGTDFTDVVPSTLPLAGLACLGTPGATACPASCAGAAYQATFDFGGTSNTITFTVHSVGGVPTNWATSQIEFELQPRPLCLQFNTVAASFATAAAAAASTAAGLYDAYPFNHGLTTAFYSGLMWEVEIACATNADCLTGVSNIAGPSASLEPHLLAAVRARDTCCGARCFNPNTELCCSTTVSTTVEISEEKCCNAGTGWTAYLEAPCPCQLQTSTTTLAAAAPVCPNEESYCCLPTKYTEQTGLNDCLAGGTSFLCGNQWGECYSPLTHRCCNTGERYDPGSEQCCSINGLQSANAPCPCGSDADCIGGDVLDYTGAADIQKVQVCCQQTAPALPTVDGAVCSDYTNYPLGSTSYTNVRCPGSCIDLRYQICCNGVTCRKEFEKCCNDTCCNLFIGTCQFGYRSYAPNRPNNAREYGVLYEQCTTIQKLDEVKSFWIFVLPAVLLLATLFGLALVLVFANKASVRVFSFIEKTIMGVAIFAALFASLLYFSPAYKYGVVVVFVSIIAIASAAARIRWLNGLALVAIGVTILYIVDPFDGNDYLTFNYLRYERDGNPRPDTHGLFHLLTRLYPRHFDADFEAHDNICTRWYQGYFQYDRLLEDNDRWNNPEVHTFAYCSRGFIVGLLITAAVMLIFLAALFILVLFGCLLRFRKNRMEPIELEIRPEPLLTVPVY